MQKVLYGENCYLTENQDFLNFLVLNLGEDILYWSKIIDKTQEWRSDPVILDLVNRKNFKFMQPHDEEAVGLMDLKEVEDGKAWKVVDAGNVYGEEVLVED